MPRSLVPRLAAALALLVASTVSGPVSAYADTEGRSGRVNRLRINTQGSEEHASYQGAIILRVVGSGELVEYRWGGSSCPGQKLNEHQQQLLATALIERSRIKVKPMFTMGEGGTRCLVGFELISA